MASRNDPIKPSTSDERRRRFEAWQKRHGKERVRAAKQFLSGLISLVEDEADPVERARLAEGIGLIGDTLQRRMAAVRADCARDLVAAGKTKVEIGELLGIAPQRVSQLVATKSL